MLKKNIAKLINSVQRSTFLRTRNYVSQVDIEKLEREPDYADVVDEDFRQKEEELELKRNKSRLRIYHRNLLNETNPFPDEPKLPHHTTLKYLRRLYGRYGNSSGVDPLVCWPSANQLKDSREYEQIAFPYTVLEAREEALQVRREKNKEIWKKQEDIIKKMVKLEEWKRDLEMRIAKKESEISDAKRRKERLIEEVRKHFGYTVDPRDDKFKEMLEKKEKEQKKAMKEARKKAKEEQMIHKLLNKKVSKSGDGEQENSKKLSGDFGETIQTEKKLKSA